MIPARPRWIRRLGLVSAVVLAGVGWVYGPRSLRELETFRIRHVEVVGTRFLDPYAVVSAAGLGAESSLFDDADLWLSGVRELALVEEIRARKIFPSKVRLEVREVAPVALVAGADGTLRPVDAAGRMLELDPAGVVLDLPILTGVQVEGGAVKAGVASAAVATVAALMVRAPGVAERVSQAQLRGGELWLTFRAARTTAVLPAAATEVQLTQLRLALSDLLARGELDRVRTLDVRFRDQVVVSFLVNTVIR